MMRTLKQRRAGRTAAVAGTTLLAMIAAAAPPARAAQPARMTPTAAQAAQAVRATPAGQPVRSGQAGLTTVKARAATEISRRQASLSARLTLVTSASPGLTSADRTALTTLLQGDQTGLARLGGTIAADTDLATARAARQQIFTGYRVYALALPQVRLVRASDTLTTQALPRLTDAQQRLTSALAAAGKTDQAATAMADLQHQLDTIRSQTSGLSTTLLSYTPARWNADHTLLQPARRSLESAVAALRAARSDIRAARTLLHR
jgi:hypothetical protein